MAREQKTAVKLIGAAIFILMEVAALSMLGHSDTIQQMWISGASHRVMARTWGASESIRYYFSLRKVNDQLAEENATLQESLRGYRDREHARMADSLASLLPSTSKYEYIPATIAKASRNKQHNYIILDKGSEDGIRPQSGIITSQGVVGIIDAVDRHYSYGLTLMNTQMNISARIGVNGAVGPLSWDGISASGAVLREIPLQFRYQPGDTVWTSGYSSIFPADIPLGIAGESRIVNGASNEIKVTLFQDFSTLRYVTVVRGDDAEEILFLERLEDGEEDPNSPEQ